MRNLSSLCAAIMLHPAGTSSFNEGSFGGQEIIWGVVLTKGAGLYGSSTSRC